MKKLENRIIIFFSILTILFNIFFITILPYQEIGEFFLPFNTSIYYFSNFKSEKIYTTKGFFLNTTVYFENGVLFAEKIKDKVYLNYLNFSSKKITKIDSFKCSILIFNINYVVAFDYSSHTDNGYKATVYKLNILKDKNSTNFKTNQLFYFYTKEIFNDFLFIDNYLYFTSDSFDSKYLNLNLLDLKNKKIIKVFQKYKNKNFLKINLLINGSQNFIILTSSTSILEKNENFIYIIDHIKLLEKKDNIFNQNNIYNNLYNYKDYENLLNLLFNEKILLKISIKLNENENLFSKPLFYNDYLYIQSINNKGICKLYKINGEKFLINLKIIFDNEERLNNFSSFYNLVYYSNNLIYYISYNYFNDKNNFYFIIFDLNQMKEKLKFHL